MALPNNTLSLESHAAVFAGARSTPPLEELTDKESQSVSINEFLTDQLDWNGVCDGSVVTLFSPDAPDQTPVTDTDITEFSFTFDQLGRATVAYVAGGVAKLRWYDTLAGQMVTTVYGADHYSPRVSLDDKHRLGSATSDIILAYIRDGVLYYRQQRDRFQIERMLAVVTTGTRLRRIGMNVANRFQFEYEETGS